MTSRTEIASKLAGKAQAAISALSGEKGIFRRLKEEHTQLAVLIGKVAKTSDPATRRALFPMIRAELLSHAKGEQAEFYSVLSCYTSTRAIAEAAVNEHAAIELMLEELHGLDEATPEWVAAFGALAIEVERHVGEEEAHLFPEARRVLSDDDAARIEHRYLERKAAESRQTEH
jgi:uncharacterized protein YdcH (DUF465 family)